MSKKRVLVLLSAFVFLSGCNVLERQSSPDIMNAPPYWQSQNQLAQTQLDEMRVFHEQESSKISEDINLFRNGEVARMAATSKEINTKAAKTIKQSPHGQQNTNEHRDNWAWLSWLNKKDKG